MTCDKRCFNSPGEARETLRLWQDKARRSNFDRMHIYQCKDDPEHRGKFHVGETHDAIKRRQRTYDETRNRIFGSLDDLFTEQTVRIRRQLSPRQRPEKDTDGPLVRPLTTLCPHGDDLNVENK